ncbi:MAG TPA: lauroyl acyltransferase [Stellaceae bacterium]|nr:lauroyl acyltransferase [Stellaceae bacterium]
MMRTGSQPASPSDPTDRRPPLAHRLEAGCAALAASGFGALPIDCASALGGALGRAVGPSLGVSRLARHNLRRAFPALDEAGIARILSGMWDNLGRVAAEYPHLRRIRLFERGGRVETRGFEHIDRAIAAKRRMILFSGHIANWEIGALAPAQYGFPAAQIYRAASNPLIDRLLARLRGGHGELIPKGRLAARRAIAALDSGRHLTLLADQKMNDGIAVPFFGRPAMTAPALAHLALRFDCDVLPARVERLQGAHFRLTVYPPLPLPRERNRHAGAAILMAAVNATLEDWIRDHPEQWLWVHRRWPD